MKKTALITFVLFILVSMSCLAENVPRSEYPRPQFQRNDWQCLNGQWDYQLDQVNSGFQRGLQSKISLEDKITVPFCPESRLSGVEYKDFINGIWYHRTVDVPSSWNSKNIILHFGAVYYRADVFINGKFIGRHFGGSSSFEFDITPYVKAGEKFELTVHAESDLHSTHQPAGKQSLQAFSYSCNYTRTTGIWQSVWLEPVDAEGLRSSWVRTDIDNQQVVIQPRFYHEGDNKLRITLNDGKKTVASTEVAASSSAVAVLNVRSMKLWSPESPFLYGLTYQVINSKGKVIDEVHSYVGARKVSVKGNRIYLNNKPYYQRLVLDQGFYPDGIWTAPSDEALRHDIELSLQAGFNGARLHQKVFEERYYYWADKLGYLTWGEAPSWGMDANDPVADRNFLAEWTEVINRDRNHPSIVIWTPLNEEWAPDAIEYPRFVSDLYDITKALDPTRLINDASGGCHIKTDIWSMHSYEQDPAKLKQVIYDKGNFFRTPDGVAGKSMNIGFNGLGSEPSNIPQYNGKMPFVIDELGGIKWTKDSQTQSWGYGEPPTSEEEFLNRLRGQIDAVLSLSDKVWGYCYTQFTDVEQEQNGIYYYDRTPKFDIKRIHEIFSRNPKK